MILFRFMYLPEITTLILLALMSSMPFFLLWQEGADGAGELKTQLALDAVITASL